MKGGEVFTAGRTVTADLGVKDGLVVAIGRYLASDRVCPVYDVRGKWVLPGFIDVASAAVSELEEGGARFSHHTARAATGGVTLVAETVVPKPWESLEQAVSRRGKSLAHSWVDRAFVVRVMAGHVPSAEQVQAAKKLGLSALIAQLSPRLDGFGLEDADLYRLALSAREAQVGLAISLEHPSFAELMTSKTPRVFKAARAELFGRQSLEAERIAAERAIAIAAAAKTKITLLGVTSNKTLALVDAAQERGVRVQAMVYTHSLTLSTKVYGKRRGRWYRPSPPLRLEGERLRLRKAFAKSNASLVIGAGAPPLPAIAAWTLEKTPRVQALTSLPWISSVLLASVGAKQWSLSRIVKALSQDPAGFLGLAGERGVISIGSVADIAVWDPAGKKKLGPRAPKTSDEFNPFVGQRATAPPMMVFSRGRLVAQNGVSIGNTSEGLLAVRIS